MLARDPRKAAERDVSCFKKSQVPLQNWLQIAEGLAALVAWPKATATSRDRHRTMAKTVNGKRRYFYCFFPVLYI